MASSVYNATQTRPVRTTILSRADQMGTYDRYEINDKIRRRNKKSADCHTA
jgi:hypothetical protein